MSLRFDQPPIVNPSGRLKAGCYLICYTLDTPEPDVIHYDGTLRVQWVDKQGNDIQEKSQSNGADAWDKDQLAYMLASGDLYAHLNDRPVTELSADNTDPILIPVFPRDEYQFYLCVKSVPCWSITPVGFNMVIESHSYDRKQRLWYPEGQFIAKMTWQLPPPGFPPDAIHATGHVYQKRGEHNGTLTMTWISKYFRRAKLVIHGAIKEKLRGSQKTLSETVVTGKSALEFAKLNWQLEADVVENESYLVRNSKSLEDPWTQGELLQVMKAIRQKLQPDQLWRYDLLCVPKLMGDERGVTLYDSEATADPSNRHVRELATIAADAKFPPAKGLNGDLYDYGTAATKTLRSQPRLFLRTAMHELGHAMGLGHNSSENGFMMTTDALARVDNQQSGKKFPENAKFEFSSGDVQRLRHWPDVLVRPGTDADGAILPAITVPVFPDPGQDEKPSPKRELARDVCLHATPLDEVAEVPLGAPVRIVFELICLGDEARVPTEPSLRSGALAIRVTAPDGSVRSVVPMINDDDAGKLGKIARVPSRRNSAEQDKRVASHPDRIPAAVTLLNDDNRPLFPSPGEYTLQLEVSWWNRDLADKGRGVEYFVEDQTKVTITPPLTPDHVEAARLVLNTPELQEVLVRQLTSFDAANEALEKALDCNALEPHFAYIEFRVQADHLVAVKGDLEPAFKVLLDAYKPEKKPPRKPFLTNSERERAQEILEIAKTSLPRGAIGTWQAKAEALLSGEDTPIQRPGFASVTRTKKPQGQNKPNSSNGKSKGRQKLKQPPSKREVVPKLGQKK